MVGNGAIVLESESARFPRANEPGRSRGFGRAMPVDCSASFFTSSSIAIPAPGDPPPVQRQIQPRLPARRSCGTFGKANARCRWAFRAAHRAIFSSRGDAARLRSRPDPGQQAIEAKDAGCYAAPQYGATL
jgi:hypothetical protein